MVWSGRALPTCIAGSAFTNRATSILAIEGRPRRFVLTLAPFRHAVIDPSNSSIRAMVFPR
jgi:hypothetical protein